MNYERVGVSFSIVVAFVIAFAPQFAGAFGISPPSITAEKLLKGSRHQSTIVLVRSDATHDITVNATFNLPEKIRSWVSLSTGNSFVIPAGTQQFPVAVLIQVPENTDLGIYQGSIDFNTVPTREAGEQVVIAVGVSLSLNLVVGEGVFSDFAIRHLDILDIREGEAPQVVITLENLGNVPVVPERATLDLFDRYGQTRLAFAQADTFAETKPFETQRLIASFPVDFRLGVGEYWAEAKVYKSGAVAGELKTVFNVTERKIPYLVYGGAVAFVAVLAFFVLRGRKSLKRTLFRNA